MLSALKGLSLLQRLGEAYHVRRIGERDVQYSIYWSVAVAWSPLCCLALIAMHLRVSQRFRGVRTRAIVGYIALYRKMLSKPGALPSDIVG